MANIPQTMDICTDILILSNAPGELTTWVFPFLKALDIALRSQPDLTNPRQTRISIALSPCQNASGREVQLAQSFPNVNRVLSQDQFFDFLLWGRTPNWKWAKQGIVIFLGGDQFFAVAIAKRLGYKTLIYAEWEARWYRWADLFAVRNQAIVDKIPKEFQAKATVVGDLMVDQANQDALSDSLPANRICFMPGSKGHKLQVGAPLVVAIADILQQKRPALELAIVIAPTTTPETLAQYTQISFPTADSDGATANIVDGNLVTAKGTVIKLYREFPAHKQIKSSQLCITTVGANTAELAALNQPMLVLLPTNFADTKVGWDGLLGLIASTPLLGKALGVLINTVLVSQIQKRGQLLAWPNIWAGEKIVPEIWGKLIPTQVATEILGYLDRPDELAKMRDRLKKVCGEAGAATKLADIVVKAL